MAESQRHAGARRRGLALIGAGAAFALAFVILVWIGLPDRVLVLAEPPLMPGGRPVGPIAGAAAPDFSIRTVDGDTVALADWQGSPVILNFWATWCGPCAAEMPDLQAVYAAYSPAGVHILGINVDEAPAVFGPWAAARGITFPLVRDVPDPTSDLSLQARYQLRGLPQTVLIGPDGVIQAVWYGPVTVGQLTAALEGLGEAD